MTQRCLLDCRALPRHGLQLMKIEFLEFPAGLGQVAAWTTLPFSALVYCLCNWGGGYHNFLGFLSLQSLISFVGLMISFPLSMKECFNLEEITI